MFGDLAVIGFLLVQVLDGALTYLGMLYWGPGIEANPLVSSAVAYAGIGGGLAAAKAIAVSGGIILHLRRAHLLVAILTVFHVAVAILPCTAILLFASR